MTALTARLIHSEDGFIVSAELVLVATIAVLAMVVGLLTGAGLGAFSGRRNAWRILGPAQYLRHECRRPREAQELS